MKTSIKKLISTLLVLVMVIGLLPTFAAAEGDDWSKYLTVTHKPLAIPGLHLNRMVTIVVKSNGNTLASGEYEIGYGVGNKMTFGIKSDWQSVYKMSDSSFSVSDGLSFKNWTTNTDTTLSANLYDLLWAAPTITINLTYDHPEHDFKETDTVPATCTEAGAKNYACICGETRSDEITALGHDWGAWSYVEGSDSADDHSTSSHSRTCSRDAAHTESANCSFVADDAQYVAPTNTSAGKYVYVCSDCGHYYEVEIPATGNKWSLTYDFNGGIGGSEIESDIPEQDAYPLNPNIKPTREPVESVNLVFVGWSSQADTKIYGKADTMPQLLSQVDLKADTTVYAVWGMDTNNNEQPDVLEDNYSLNYDANNGNPDTVPVDTNKYIAGDVAQIDTATVPTYMGVQGGEAQDSIVFAGWTSEAVDTILTKDDEPVTTVSSVEFVDADIRVYAAWAYDMNGNGKPDVDEEQFTLTYEANGGEGGPGTVSDLLAQDEYVLENTNVPTHAAVDGKPVVFAGWSMAQDKQIYAKGDALPSIVSQVNISADTVVYAVYGYDEDSNGKADIFDDYAFLYYDANGGKGAPENEAKLFDQGSAQFKVSDVVPTREEYTFKGWSQKADGAVEFKAGETVEITNDYPELTLFAVWELNPLVKYTITYDANGGKDAPDAQSVESRTGKGEFVITSKVPTREGYKFVGWATSKNGGAEYYGGNRVNVTGNVTLYAVWLSNATPPKTGDDSNIGLWLSLASLSALGMGAALHFGKKRKQED